jgi:hypothetical protein
MILFFFYFSTGIRIDPRPTTKRNKRKENEEEGN